MIDDADEGRGLPEVGGYLSHCLISIFIKRFIRTMPYYAQAARILQFSRDVEHDIDEMSQVRIMSLTPVSFILVSMISMNSRTS